MKEMKECKCWTIFAYVVEAYRATRDSDRGPEATVDLALTKCGKQSLQHVVAAAVNTKAWDGRISPRNAAWAAQTTREGLETNEAYYQMIGLDSIHTAHLDQIADVVRSL